ncbi:MAG: TonB-dependent receptor [Steroidobacteraceae bacterium]
MFTQKKPRSTPANHFVPPEGKSRDGYRVNSGLVAATILMTALAGNVCLAAESAAAGDAPLEEIIVTAQKRSERLLDVPMSITAISGNQLTAANITSTLDLSQVTPGLLMTNIGTGFTPSLRGVSSSGTSPGDESNVALYVDDIYVGDTLAGWFQLPDVERVEVLKGPQGTLYGRNSTGGAIRIETRAPSFTPEVDATAEYGFNFRETRLTGFATGPLTDKIAGSFSAFYDYGDGFVDGSAGNVGRTYGGPDDYVYRGKLLFEFSDTFHATFSSETSQTDNQSGALPTSLSPNPYPLVPGAIPNTPYNYAGGTQPEQLVTSYGASLDAYWTAAPWVTMRSISAYTYYDLTYQVDIDRTAAPLSALALKATQRNFSQEFNFFGPSDQTFTWLLGAFYYDSSAGNPYFTSFTGDAPNGPVVANFYNNVGTNSYAAFADLTWNITAALHATIGGRYTTETKDYTYADTVRAGGLPLRDVHDDATWNSPTYRAVVRYDLTPEANVYVSLSDGFKSGVFNSFSPLPIPVSPEKIYALEVGAKARIGPIGLTAAGYGYNYDDIQVQAQTLVNGIPLLTLNNAASAKIRGAELSADGNLGDTLNFSVGVNYEPEAEYSSYGSASVTVPIPPTPGGIVGEQIVPYNASGSRMIKAPEWTPDLRLTYKTRVMEGALAITVNDAYTSSFYWQPGNFTKEEAYNLVNARVSWTDPKDRWTFSLWGTNLGDVVYSTYTSPNTRGNTETYNQPRQVGVGAALKF